MKNNSNYPSIHSEGGLLPMDLPEQVAALEAERPAKMQQPHRSSSFRLSEVKGYDR